MLRGLRIFGLALCSIAEAIAQPRIDLAVAPAWNGWTRPGRTTELDIRLTTGAATRATLDIVAGRQTVRAELDLEPGRVVRLQVPVDSAERFEVSAGSPAAPAERRDVGMAQSESPLLGVGLATLDAVQFEGFHTIALDADDLPRNASAYSSIDALILDAPTLGALDQRQLGALLAYTAGCGRTVLLNPDLRVRQVLEGAAGCRGHALMSAASLTAAKEMLAASLATSRGAAISLAGTGELGRTRHAIWNRILVIVAAYFAVATLAALFFSSLPVFLLVPVLASAVMLALLHAMQPTPQLLVWSESESGAQVARYQAWQRFPGLARGRERVPVLPQLASARSCDTSRPMRFDFDAAHGRATFAEFDTRLFAQVSLCYSGSFPVPRTIGIEARPDGALEVRNAGTMAWPDGVLVAGRLAHDLPALGPGENTIIRTHTGRPPPDAATRTALSRTQADRPAVLWKLEVGRVADLPIDSTAWLLVLIPPP